jgi:transcriptional regulator of NAD metabolism
MQPDPQWRAANVYAAKSTSATGLLDETRLFLKTYAALGDLWATHRVLIDGGLHQRSRSTRQTILKKIKERLTSWNPPAWALHDLAAFAQEENPAALQAALLIHVPRQDRLLYDVVQHVVTPRWEAGVTLVTREDVQRFLDHMTPTHPEIERWTHGTRAKLASSLLSILRDYGLLKGKEHKQIVEPVIPDPVVQHLARLLRAEGMADGELAYHPDWRLWLWDAARAQEALVDRS